MRKKLILLSVLIPFFLSNHAFSKEPEKALQQFITESGVPRGSMAVKIIDLADNTTLASHNSDLPLVPASIMKSITTASLYEKAGGDWRYHTKVFVDGPTDMGKVRGNLIIVGACDPSLHSEYEPYGSDLVKEISETLLSQRISAIEGEIIIDETEFAGASRPGSWAKGDFGKYYGTGSHAFNFSNNASGDNAVEDPAGQFVRSLQSELLGAGIKIEGKNVGEGKRKELLDHLSPPLDEIMRSCMMRSDNLFAECLLRTYGKLNGRDGSTSEAAIEEISGWQSKGFPMEGVNIVDGSGLSRQNRMTADFMGSVLTDMSKDAVYASFFPLAGQEGTMKKFLAGTELDSYLAMKTGSMNGILCYAGYKLDDDYVPTHVIVVMMNDVKGRDRAKKSVEKMMLDIFCDD